MIIYLWLVNEVGTMQNIRADFSTPTGMQYNIITNSRNCSKHSILERR